MYWLYRQYPLHSHIYIYIYIGVLVVPPIPLALSKYFESRTCSGIGSATNTHCTFKGIFCFISWVLAVPSIPLNFHTYCFFVLVVSTILLSSYTYCLFHHLKDIGGAANLLKRSYVLFGLYSKGFWWCRHRPLRRHEKNYVSYPAILAVQLNSHVFVYFLGFLS